MVSPSKMIGVRCAIKCRHQLSLTLVCRRFAGRRDVAEAEGCAEMAESHAFITSTLPMPRPPRSI